MAFVVVSLLLVAWATLSPRGGAMLHQDAERFCLWCGGERISDAIANVVLFIPLGAALVVNGMRPLVACGACLLLTLGIETTQYFGLPAGRIASVSDAITNVMGGAIGATLARWHRLLLFPRRNAAAALSCAWTAVVAATLAATAWGTSTPDSSRGGAVPAAMRSPLTHVPLSSWYQGEIVGALVNGTEFPQRGTGPIIVQAVRQERTVATLAVVGRDTVRDVPMLYVHAPDDMRPYLLLSQRRSGISLRGSSRGSDAGFAPLETSVQDAFAAGIVHPADTALVIARTTRRELSLAVQRGGRHWTSVQLRTPTIGWALIQSLVRVSSPYANALTAAWLLILLLPLGYWGWWSGNLRAYVTLGAALVIAVATVAAVRTFGIAFPPLWQWCTLAGGIAFGMLPGQLTLAYDSRGDRHEDHGTVDG